MSAASLLWSLQPPEGKSSWLFGTMHIRDERVYQFCHILYPLIQEADVYVGEMDLSVMPFSMVETGYNIREHFTPKAYGKLRKQLLKSFQVDIDRYAHLHPMMILSLITQSVLESDHAISLDEHLWNYAREHQLQLQGLETVREQVQLLHSIEPAPLYKQIKDISEHPATIRRFTDRALAYYVNAQPHLLYQLTKSSMHRLRKRIIYQRNEVMSQRIGDYEPELRYFITVGAGHLSGPFGLISKLRKKGWRVTPASSTLQSGTSLEE